ncbi:YbhB/YbcL family Raf kinase inhibitor-like protein [Kiloniella sp. b19]|uniref:YbhB/YbcL family Raf kinase inhibitor-like protein n=1 Tax=Kiloniella sp. GXU_MW_B19 TaxID=3141326 RepID=UPI0031D6B605
MSLLKSVVSLPLLLSVSSALAGPFTLSSPDIAEGEIMPLEMEFSGFGCEGGNLSPALSWSGAPKGTKSYALTVYDPDAPTGSGWWHWFVAGIPADVHALEKGTRAETLPSGAFQLQNDYGGRDFGGACPPEGEMHRYQFTVHALDVEALPINENVSSALAGFMVGAHTLDSAAITAVYVRK